MTITAIKQTSYKDKTAEERMKETKLKKGLVFTFTRENKELGTETFTLVVVNVKAGKLQVISINSWNRFTDETFNDGDSCFELIASDYEIINFKVANKMLVDINWNTKD
jgi:hypothetical protein